VFRLEARYGRYCTYRKEAEEALAGQRHACIWAPHRARLGRGRTQTSDTLGTAVGGNTHRNGMYVDVRLVDTRLRLAYASCQIGIAPPSSKLVAITQPSHLMPATLMLAGTQHSPPRISVHP
jgi:hypothetical protein